MNVTERGLVYPKAFIEKLIWGAMSAFLLSAALPRKAKRPLVGVNELIMMDILSIFDALNIIQ